MVIATRQRCLWDSDVRCHVHGCELEADKYMAFNPRRTPVCFTHYSDRWELGLVDDNDNLIVEVRA